MSNTVVLFELTVAQDIGYLSWQPQVPTLRACVGGRPLAARPRPSPSTKSEKESWLTRPRHTTVCSLGVPG